MMPLGAPEWLNGLWLVPALIVLSLHAVTRGRRLLERFIEARLRTRMTPGRSELRFVLKSTLVCFAIGSLIVALSRPQWNAKPKDVVRSGRDICFVLDVSKSMLAEDLAPNRLERAKLWINDVLDVVEGDRVALVAFAGVSVVKCPLTHDYAFLRTALEDTTPDSVPRGGTLIGDAIRTAVNEVFRVSDDQDTTEARFRDLILITDGEDHESFPLQAAEAAGAAGVRIVAIGIGDEDRGQPIPLTDAAGRRVYLQYGGETVLSRLDAETLRAMAATSHEGVYFNVATGTIELDRVYQRLIRDAERRELESSSMVVYEEKFQIFLGVALTMLVLDSLIALRRRSAS